MHILLMSLHIIVCFVIVFVVLVQSSKGSQMGAAFGGSSQTVFGSRGAATFLTKL
ncbi:MAG: preprotein translocase subunit SecG, partial [Nitrospirae bacterium]|nr:preprotein translocase subunit SecG [Nitrospirota bacterium]